MKTPDLDATMSDRPRPSGDPLGPSRIVGQHPSMQRLHELMTGVARAPVNVLITGESGTGKELVARAIHQRGPRPAGPFVAVNVAAMPETLIESELFGHERGAFTGAVQRKPGRVELAHGGTLFLDEIATLRVDLQAKLLRVLQEREVERLGGVRPIQVDVRVVSATNVDLGEALRQGTFREDLYYRLNVVEITVPPLRERRADIPLLAAHFVAACNRQFGTAISGVSHEAMQVLVAHDWPGNVRELESTIARAAVLGRGALIELHDLPLERLSRARTGTEPTALPPPLPRALPNLLPEALPKALPQALKVARQRFERELILQVLELVQWNQSRAARYLGLHRNSLKVKLAHFGIRPGDPGA